MLLFQSTRLYKPRQVGEVFGAVISIFQSTRLYKPRPFRLVIVPPVMHFNPRGCISLDETRKGTPSRKAFQSTRLYKPRPNFYAMSITSNPFQSTRLYKPRRSVVDCIISRTYFNPRGCISLDCLFISWFPVCGISIHEAV